MTTVVTAFDLDESAIMDRITDKMNSMHKWEELLEQEAEALFYAERAH